MTFKFFLGSEVQARDGLAGKVIALIETVAGFHYRILEPDGRVHEVPQKRLRIVSCVPPWLRAGAEIQWVGEGPHERYVVRKLRRGGRWWPRSFDAEREQIRPDGTSYGSERVSTQCTSANMRYWRPAIWRRERRGRPAGSGLTWRRRDTTILDAVACLPT